MGAVEFLKVCGLLMALAAAVGLLLDPEWDWNRFTYRSLLWVFCTLVFFVLGHLILAFLEIFRHKAR